MFLITTADERAWQTDDQVLFLGEWCKLYSRKQVWSNLSFEVLPYHWDDRDKMHRDFQYLTGVYERYLKEISLKLNALHGTDHGERYWKIVIGPWLRYFTDTLFDRYSSLKVAADLNKITLTSLMPSEKTAWVPRDFNQFNSDQKTDPWNHYIYGQIIKSCGMIPYQEIDVWNNPVRANSRDQQLSDNKSFIKSTVDRYVKNIAKSTANIVFVSSYFDRASLTKLQLAVHHLPQPSWGVIQVPQEPVDCKRREQLKINIAGNEFEKVLETIIPWQIPVSYFETFKHFVGLSADHYPSQAQVIYTANAYNADEGFKIWCAGKIEKGSKLVIGQHGGMGSVLFSQEEDHQLAVSDRFYSWGWANRDKEKISILPACKLIHLKREKSDSGKGPILWVMASVPRYSYYMCSMPVGPQFLDYMNDQITLSRHMIKPVIDLLQIRLERSDFGWGFADRLKDSTLDHALKDNDGDFIQSLKKSRLFIGTHNSTTILEAFVLNHPTLIYWDPRFYEIRPKANGYFNELRRVGILHDTPGAAASTLNKIYGDPLSWWQQPERQAAKDRFCDQFAYVSDNWVRQWKKELLSL